jgi:transcriptional regulator with XRE-family HTH domain
MSAAYTIERARILNMLGDNLRSLRVRRNLAQERLAEVASLHRNEIGVLERGQCEPGVLTLLIVTNALMISPHILLDGLPVPRERRSRKA